MIHLICYVQVGITDPLNIRNSFFSSELVQPRPHCYQPHPIQHPTNTNHRTDYKEAGLRSLQPRQHWKTTKIKERVKGKKKKQKKKPFPPKSTMSSRPPPSPSTTTPKPKPSTSKPTPSTSKSKTTTTTPKPKPKPSTAPRPHSPETHLSFSARNLAAKTLQSYEELAWHALARNESIPQVVLHFKSILAGFTPADRDSTTTTTSTNTTTSSPAHSSPHHWKSDITPHQPGSYWREQVRAAGLEGPLGGEGRRKCSGTSGGSTSSMGGKGKGKEREREGGRGSLGGGVVGSPRGSLGGEGSGRRKRKSAGGGGG